MPYGGGALFVVPRHMLGWTVVDGAFRGGRGVRVAVVVTGAGRSRFDPLTGRSLKTKTVVS